MANDQRENLMKKVENHLRITSRQLIKIDTEEEALQYLTDSFRSELYCDFVGVVLNENGQLIPKAWSGNTVKMTAAFPIPVDECSLKLFHQSLTYETAEKPDQCLLLSILKKERVKTWFTVPIKDESQYFGFCIIGFLSYVPLLDMESHFEEFGKDVALAMAMTRRKEARLKKIEGIEWISKNLSIDSPLEENIGELTLRAGKGTNADFACIFLYNEKDNSFVLQHPAYGDIEQPNKIMIKKNYVLKEYFPFLETPGGHQLTLPIVIDLKTIGVLHVENKKDERFTEDDMHMLELLGNHIGTMLENARLYNSEKDHKQRLHFLLDYQQSLVKETVLHEGFDGIISMLGSLFNDTVLLFDRFVRPISYTIQGEEEVEEAVERIREHAVSFLNQKNNGAVFNILEEKNQFFSFWPVSGGNHLLGYLAVRLTGSEMEEFDKLAIELARNICSIQFIKQKLVLDAKEQAKDSFINRLLVKKIEDEESILQYANLFHWNLFQPHRLAVLSITLMEPEMRGCNLLEQQAKKIAVWDYIKSSMKGIDEPILSASFNDQFILIIPASQKEQSSKTFWKTLYDRIKAAAENSSFLCRVVAGFGGKTELMGDYYISYQQAIQALNVVQNRYRDQGFALFDELGSYTILHHLDHSAAVELFMNNQIGPLLKYSEGKNIDLLNTLRCFLQNNGNVKSTAEELYIHRSSLLYRLEKVEHLLEADLNDAEVRFNLMMAFKLFDMHGQTS